jgi:hypothetical protein
MRRGGKRKYFLPVRAASNECQPKESFMTRILARVALFAFAVAMSISAFAGSSKTQTLTLLHDAQLNGTTIPAGEYTLKYDTNGSTCQVKVLKGRKEVASADGQVKQLASKPEHSQVVLANGGSVPSISEVDFDNSTTAITFESSMANAGK